MVSLNIPVENVLNGAAADGARLSERPLPFTKDPEVRRIFAENVAYIVERVEKDAEPLDNQQLTGLVRKLALHCNAAGWQKPGKISQLHDAAADISDVIREDRSLLTNKTGIQGMLNAHLDHDRKNAATAAKGLSAISAPNDVAYTDDGAFKLVELVHPDHLIAQSAAIKDCCVGTDYNKEALAARELKESDPQAKHFLRYALYMHRGESRLFSLRGADERIYATLEYDTKTKSISKIESYPRKIESSAPFFPALCETLYKLSEKIPVRKIEGLPEPEIGRVLTRGGSFSIFSGVLTDDILKGHVLVDDNTPQALLEQLAASPRLLLNVTKLTDLSRLPPNVEADLINNAIEFNAPLLKSAKNIHADRAEKFSAPLLRTAKNIRAISAFEFAAPALEKADVLGLNEVRELSVPLLQEAGDINASAIANFYAPELKKSENIIVTNTISLNAPKLSQAAEINARSAKIVNLPKLQKAGPINASSAENFSVPELQEAKHIQVACAGNFNAPKLKKAGHINADEAVIFNIPLLRTAENIHAEKALRFFAPDLRQALDIYANSAKHFQAMQLHTAGDIYADKAVYFNAPDLVKIKAIKAISATHFAGPANRATLSQAMRIRLSQERLRNDTIDR